MKLPVTNEEVRQCCRRCSICAQEKPQFKKLKGQHVIRALKPMDRLSIDFKGPLPNTVGNYKYLFVGIDEYSRYPFAIPCRDMSSNTVIYCLESIFALVGPPSFLHSDNGTSLVSKEVKDFLWMHGVASSNSTVYNPTGNSQVERYVGTIWKTIVLNCGERRMSLNQWNKCVNVSLDNIRSLVNTCTGKIPHDRMFGFPRKIVSIDTLDNVGKSRYQYLPGDRVFIKRFVKGKFDPLVEEVIMHNCNPNYSEVELSDGRMVKISNKNISHNPNNEKAIKNIKECDTTNDNPDDFNDDSGEVVHGDELFPPGEDEVLDHDFEGFDDGGAEVGEGSSGLTSSRPERLKRRPIKFDDYI